MADVKTILSALGLATATAGALTDSVGAYRNAKAQKTAARWQASVERNNAALAEWEAQDALMRGEEAWQQHRLKTASLKGAQRARMASNGVLLSEGSPLRILTDTDYLSDVDAQTIRRNASREAYLARSKAVQSRNNASLLEFQGDSISPMVQAGATFLDGASTVASKWYAYSTGASAWQIGQT